MDEIDSILSARSESEHEASRRVKTEFMTQVDGATSNSETRLLIMGATNIPWELDEAVLRRFVKRICIPLPDKTTRTVLIKKLLDKQQNDSSSSKGGIFSVLRGSHTCSELISSHQLEVLATNTEGYSASDITALIKEAAMGPIRSLTPEELVKIRTSDVRPINGDVSIFILLDFIFHIRIDIHSFNCLYFAFRLLAFLSFDEFSYPYL
jgi:SpoVK/Ycf46/Vps4 family AAA+-type ATPase